MMHRMTDVEYAVAREYGLRPDEARVLVALCALDPEPCPLDVVHGNSADCKVLISKLRAKMRSHGVGIRNVRGLGYVLENAEQGERDRLARDAERLDRIVRLYSDGEKVEWIAASCGVCTTTVVNVARRAGVPARRERVEA